MERPPKRRKALPPALPTGVKASASPRRSVDLKPVIELESDGEESKSQVSLTSCSRESLKPQQQRYTSIESTSSDEEFHYDAMHAGYDLKNSSIVSCTLKPSGVNLEITEGVVKWKPMKVNEHKMEFRPQDTFKSIRLDIPTFINHGHPDISNEHRLNRCGALSALPGVAIGTILLSRSVLNLFSPASPFQVAGFLGGPHDLGPYAQSPDITL